MLDMKWITLCKRDTVHIYDFGKEYHLIKESFETLLYRRSFVWIKSKRKVLRNCFSHYNRSEFITLLARYWNQFVIYVNVLIYDFLL